MKRQVTLLGSPTAFRAVSITVAWNSSKRSQVIEVSNVSERTPSETSESRRYGAERNAERHAPTLSSSSAESSCVRTLTGLAAVLPSRVDRDPHRLVDRVMRRLEAEHEKRVLAVARAGERGLGRVEEAAVRRVEAGLRDLANRGGARRERVELDSA